MSYRLKERTYVDAKGKATTDRIQGVRLLGPAGRVVTDAVAEQVGLKQMAKVADKMVRGPANKKRGTIAVETTAEKLKT